MDSAIWIALIGIIGTLVGVWLGNFLQNRNLKQQREWLLRDQKSEWVRKQKREDFTRILDYVEGTIKFFAVMGDTFNSVSKEKQEQIILEFKKQVASVIPIVEGIKDENRELDDLFNKFIQEKDKVFKTIITTKDASKGNAADVIKIAGQIKKRINDSLAETFK